MSTQILDCSNEDNLLLNEATRVLTSVGRNLRGLFSDFANPPGYLGFGSDLASLQRQTQLLKENIQYLVGTQLFGTLQAMSSVETELNDLRTKYANLQNEWDNQQEHLGRMQNELYRLRNQVTHQSQFCASLGAVMGNLVWKSSRLPQVVDLVVGGNKVGDFLSIVNGTLESFMGTYAEHMPHQNADETQFITSMCGIITNLAATSTGRQFLVTNVNGIELMEQFVKVLPKLPSPSGNSLKRLILMSLYNVSINQYGLKFLQEKSAILDVIKNNLLSDTTHELKLMCMSLLQSITFDVSSPELLKNIEEMIPQQILEELSRGTETDIKVAAKDVMDNLLRARNLIATTSYQKKDAQYNDCYFENQAEECV